MWVKNLPRWFQIAVVVVLVVAAGVGLDRYTAYNQSKIRKVTLDSLQKEQRALADKQRKQSEHTSEGHADVANTEFKDVSSGDFKKSSCKRLENRKTVIITSSNCDYRLRAYGRAKAAVVFVYESYLPQDQQVLMQAKSESDKNSLFYINTYLKRQAARYKVSDPLQLDMDFYGPYKLSTKVSQLYYRDSSTTIMQAFNEASANNKVPEENYDIVEFIFMDGGYGGIAMPYLHRAFSYDSYVPQLPAIFTHETLHLFGASDKYNNNDCNTIGTGDPFGRYEGTKPGIDIMCVAFNLDSSSINDITAREIGWGN